MAKINVGILFGGRSAEHEVSIISAGSVIKNLDFTEHIPMPIYIDTAGKFHLLPSFLAQDCAKSISILNDEVKKIQDNGNVSEYYSIDKWLNFNKGDKKIDVALPILHGTFGEDGAIQGFFELLNVPYIGSGILSSAIAMDKELAKKIVCQSGITVTPFLSIKSYEYEANENNFLTEVLDKFFFPLFVKPCNCGSSIGISKVKNINELKEAIDIAFKYDKKILIEQAIDGKEIELSVLENINDCNTPIVSYPGELIPKDEFYTYDAKYVMKDGAEFKIPAELPDTIQKIARQTAIDIFKILECNGLARVDFFFEEKTNQLLFNEINTLPGFTEISLYPKLLEHYGIKYGKLLKILIHLALKKHKEKLVKINNSVGILNSIKFFR